MIKKKSVIHTLILITFLGIIFGAFYISIYMGFNASQSNNLKLIASQKVNNPYMTEIIGQIKNDTDKEFLYTNVIFNLYDAKGNEVGQVVDNSGDLKPGAIWKFDAIGALADTKTYKVVQLTGR
jgi:hypothetical protein